MLRQRHQGDPGTRSRVSHSAVKTQWQLHLSRWDRLVHYKTPCNGAHFGHAQSSRRGFAFSWIRSRNEVKSPWQLRKVSNSAPKAPLVRSSNAQNRSIDPVISRLRLQKPLEVFCDVTRSLSRCDCASTKFKLNVLFFILLRSHNDPKASAISVRNHRALLPFLLRSGFTNP